MTIRDEELDGRLLHLFGSMPTPDTGDRLRSRVQDVIAAQSARPRPTRRRRAVLGLALSLLAAGLIAATAAATALFEGLIGDNQSWQLAWERSVELGIEATLADGTTVVLERGYADANQVLVGLRSSDAGGIGLGQLSDTTDRHYVMSSGAGETVENGSILLMNWVADEPLPAGEMTFTLATQVEPGLEPTRVEFVLSIDAGTDVSTEVAAQHDGFGLTLRRVTISPTIITARVDLEALPDAPQGGWQAWTPIAHLEGPAGSFDIGMGSPADQDDPETGRMVLYTEFGTADWNGEKISGEWKLVVTEVVGFDADGEQTRVAGPWELPFSVP